jgi:hypothetical protein
VGEGEEPNTGSAKDKTTIWMQVRINQLALGTTGQVGGASKDPKWGQNIYVSQAVVVGWDPNLKDTKLYTDEDLLRMGVAWEESQDHGPYSNERKRIEGVLRPDIPGKRGILRRDSSVQQILNAPKDDPGADPASKIIKTPSGITIPTFDQFADADKFEDDPVNTSREIPPKTSGGWDRETILGNLGKLRGHLKADKSKEGADPAWFVATVKDDKVGAELNIQSLIPDIRYKAAVGGENLIRSGNLVEGDKPPADIGPPAAGVPRS